MKIVQRLIWPFLILLGLLFVFVIDPGNGLSSPGFWLVPVGIVGGLVSTNKRLGIARTKYLSLIWLLALVSFGIMFFLLLFGEGFDALDWIIPTTALMVAGIVALVIYSVKD